MLDDEDVTLTLGTLEDSVADLELRELLQETSVASLRHDQLFVQERHDTMGPLRDQVDHGLVVNELDVLELDLFSSIHLLLQFEGVHVEVLLKHFVGEVDAQLFKAVLLENFEAEDIQDPDESQVLRHSER